MKQRILRRLEALEEGYRSRQQKEVSSAKTALAYIWKIVLGYYLGGLKSDDGLDVGYDEDDLRPAEAEWRALKYRSNRWEVFLKVDDIEGWLELHDRYNDAYRRLFAKVGLDFDKTPRNVLFDALVKIVDQLPDQWLNWLSCNLRRWCPDAEIAVGSNLPRRLCGDNMFLLGGEPRRHQNATRKK
jgi:hypothetical protein